MRTSEPTDSQQVTCDCGATHHGPWMCSIWVSMKLPISDASKCNFVELRPDSVCLTQTQQWQYVSKTFSESCVNESNAGVSDLLMIGATWVGNGSAATAMENYRGNLKQQGVADTSSKYLFHVSQTWDDTINICKKGFNVPTQYRPGRHIIGMGVYAGQPKYVANLTSDLGRGQRLNDEILTINNPLIMLMCEVIPGKSYPAYRPMDGSPLMAGYNSHMSVGVPPHEMCFFSEYAIRPTYILKVIRYRLEIQRDLKPVLPASTMFAFFKRNYESFLEKRERDAAKQIQQGAAAALSA